MKQSFIIVVLITSLVSCKSSNNLNENGKDYIENSVAGYNLKIESNHLHKVKDSGNKKMRMTIVNKDKKQTSVEGFLRKRNNRVSFETNQKFKFIPRKSESFVFISEIGIASPSNCTSNCIVWCISGLCIPNPEIDSNVCICCELVTTVWQDCFNPS